MVIAYSGLQIMCTFMFTLESPFRRAPVSAGVVVSVLDYIISVMSSHCTSAYQFSSCTLLCASSGQIHEYTLFHSLYNKYNVS